MSAYWISVYKEIIDEAKVAAYAELAGPALRTPAAPSSPAACPSRPTSRGSRPAPC